MARQHIKSLRYSLFDEKIIKISPKEGDNIVTISRDPDVNEAYRIILDNAMMPEYDEFYQSNADMNQFYDALDKEIEAHMSKISSPCRKDKHEVIENQANGKKFHYCRDCKKEVT